MDKPNPIQIQRFLGGLDYPCDRETVIRHAKKQGADQHVMQTLERLPEERFQTPADVSQAIGRLDR